MFKRFLAILVALAAATAFAAVDVNKASLAELESVKGIGPAIASKIVDERKKGNFKDWTDMVDRVKGVGDGNAAKFSAEGLTVNGQGFKGVAAKPAADKPADKAAAKPAMEAKPAAAPKAEAAKAADKPAAADKAKADKMAAADKAPAAKASKSDKPAAAVTAAASAPAAKK